jgi:hypothetical protein
VPSNNAQKPCPPRQQDIIPYVVKSSILRSWRWAKVCPKHVELILEINKIIIVASSWCSILLYLQWCCTVTHKSNRTYPSSPVETWWHTVTQEVEVKGKLVKSGKPVLFTLPRNMLFPSLLPLILTPQLPVVDWTDFPADLNGLVILAERRNLVSARVPSHFKRSLPMTRVKLGLWHVDWPALWCSFANYSRFPCLSPRPVLATTLERETRIQALCCKSVISCHFYLTSLLISLGKVWSQNRFILILLT